MTDANDGDNDNQGKKQRNNKRIRIRRRKSTKKEKLDEGANTETIVRTTIAIKHSNNNQQTKVQEPQNMTSQDRSEGSSSDELNKNATTSLIPVKGECYNLCKRLMAGIYPKVASGKYCIYHLWLGCLYDYNVSYSKIEKELKPLLRTANTYTAIRAKQIFIVGQTLSSGCIKPAGSCFILVDMAAVKGRAIESKILQSKFHMFRVDVAMLRQHLKDECILLLPQCYKDFLSEVPLKAIVRECEKAFPNITHSVIKDNSAVALGGGESTGSSAESVLKAVVEQSTDSNLNKKQKLQKPQQQKQLEVQPKSEQTNKQTKQPKQKQSQPQQAQPQQVQPKQTQPTQTQSKQPLVARKQVDNLPVVLNRRNRLAASLNGVPLTLFGLPNNLKTAQPLPTSGDGYGQAEFEARLHALVEDDEPKSKLVTKLMPRLTSLGNVVLRIDHLPAKLTIHALNLMMGTYGITQNQVVAVDTVNHKVNQPLMNIRVVLPNDSKDIKIVLSKNNCRTAYDTILLIKRTDLRELESFMRLNHTAIRDLYVEERPSASNVGYSNVSIVPGNMRQQFRLPGCLYPDMPSCDCAIDI